MKKGRVSMALKNFGAILVSAFATILFTAQCFALTGGIVLKTDKSDLSAGDEITVTVDLPEETKIYALTATLQYDQNVFELIDSTNFSVPDTASLSYNGQNNQFGIVNQTGVVNDDLLVMHLRVKDDANVGDTNLALTNISSSDGQTKTEYSSATTKVLVTRNAAEGETISTATENTIIEESQPTENVFYSTPFIIIAAILVGVIILVALLHFSNLTPHTSKLYYGLITLGVIICVLIGAITAINNSRKDVDADGVVSYDDAQSIIDYLINLRGNDDSTDNPENDETASTDNSSRSTATLTSASNSNSSQSSSASSQSPSHFDTNNDGKVDINDAGHNAEEAQKITTVELSKTDDDKYYAQKGNQTVQFVAKISPDDVTLKKVKINDQEYHIDPANIDGELYTVEVEPMSEIGKHDYHISEVHTSNGKTIPQNLDISYEVLKEKPKVFDFNHDLDNSQINFKLQDTDSAFQKGEVKVYNSDDREEPFITQPFESTDDIINVQHKKFASERGASFYVEILGDYCLVEDQTSGAYCYSNESLLAHQFTMDDHYDFTLSNYSLSDYVEPNSHPFMNFNSSNSKGLPVSNVRVLIDDATELEFPVTLAGDGTFEVKLPSQTQPGQRHKVIIKDVTLSDGMTFVSPDDFPATELTYFVPNNLPKVTDLTLTSDKSQKKITAQFDLTDPSTISQLKVVMVDGANNIVATDTLSKENIGDRTDFSVSFDYSNLKDRSFTIKVLADYDLGGQYSFNDAVLAEDYIEVFDDKMLYVQDNVVTAANIANNNQMKVTRYAEKGQKGFGIAMTLVKDANYILRGACGAYSNNTAYTVNGNNYNSFGFGTWDKLTGMCECSAKMSPKLFSENVT